MYVIAMFLAAAGPAIFHTCETFEVSSLLSSTEDQVPGHRDSFVFSGDRS